MPVVVNHLPKDTELYADKGISGFIAFSAGIWYSTFNYWFPDSTPMWPWFLSFISRVPLLRFSYGSLFPTPKHKLLKCHDFKSTPSHTLFLNFDIFSVLASSSSHCKCSKMCIFVILKCYINSLCPSTESAKTSRYSEMSWRVHAS